MRTFDEIDADIRQATRKNDIEAMRMLAAELEALGTAKAMALRWSALGNTAKFTSDYALALEHYRHALSAYEELEDRDGVATVTANMGSVYSKTGDYPSALEHHRRALAVQEELGNRRSQARIIGNIGSELSSTGDYPSAMEHFSRALSILEELDDRIGMAIFISNMGLVCFFTGDYPAALTYYRRAQALNEELDYRAGVALVTKQIASLHLITGDHPTALEHYHHALALLEELGDPAGLAGVTSNVGSLHFLMGDYTSALEYSRRALALHEELGSRSGVVIDLGNVVDALLKLDRIDEAATFIERKASMQMNDPRVVVQHLFHVAALAEHRNDLEVAEGQLHEALATCTKTGLRAEFAETHGRLRDLAQKRNDFAGYIEHNKEYQRITEEIRGKEATQRMAMMEAERKMEGERREREKERALLYGTLPKSVADRMIRGEKITGDHFDHAAVLFIDVAAFTTHTAAMHPGDVVILLEDLFSRIDSICERHGVVKVKTIGDSYMCFAHEGNGESGMGNNSEQGAASPEQRVAAVALEVQQTEFYWPREGLLDRLLFRIGIHSGPVTAGVIGTQRLQYDVWGDTVNVASRMESHGEPGRIHVSEAFALLLTPSSQFPVPCSLTPRGPLEIKGKGTMTTYWLEQLNENL